MNLKVVFIMQIIADRKTYPHPESQHFNLHTHAYYEIYCFLQGDAKYFIDGNIYDLNPKDILFIRSSESHRLLLNSHAAYERTVITFCAENLLGDNIKNMLSFFDNLPIGSNNLYPASVFKNKHWHYYINQILSAENADIKKLYLSILVTELCESYTSFFNSHKSKDVILDIITYLNEHLTENLSLESICNEFYISKSHLNRKFKMLTDSTVWEYITTKRLFAAKEMLQNGEPPTKVFSKCGFNDYTSFFRAYKLKFGSSPKYDIIKTPHK